MTDGSDRSAQAGDPRFYRRAGPYSLAAVVDAAGAEAPPRRLMLHGLAPLAAATEQDIAFCINSGRHRDALAATRAAAVIVHPDMADAVPATAVAILSVDPLAAWTKVAALFHPLPPVIPGIHPSAIIAATARIHPSVEVGPLAVIGEHAVIGPRGRIGALAVIGDGVAIGSDVRIGSHVTVSHALVGDRVYLYPGVRIGQEGFGIAATSDGLLSVPQLGRVLIEDDVEIGANTTVDRGALEDTVIGAGTRIDNLVQVAHNVRLGRACVITAQVGIAGSAVIGDFVVIGGQAGIAGHTRLVSGVRVAARSGVMGDILVRSDVVGNPAQPARAFFREVALLRKWVKAGRPPGKASHSNADSD